MRVCKSVPTNQLANRLLAHEMRARLIWRLLFMQTQQPKVDFPEPSRVTNSFVYEGAREPRPPLSMLLLKIGFANITFANSDGSSLWGTE